MATANISIPEDVKNKAQRASIEMIGEINLSAYLKVLINQDCNKRGIK